ncbi:hypothetical protein EYF80_017365 [Liparis tanakae]|uniref:Uncharacterized protein n=1 Tax=Liparis tanakae TaxID=230148 RepID=A0A4Z2I2Z9_9TELE|nr:hypothetical protein EYF80_017365 [Liparis tanakae]
MLIRLSPNKHDDSALKKGAPSSSPSIPAVWLGHLQGPDGRPVVQLKITMCKSTFAACVDKETGGANSPEKTRQKARIEATHYFEREESVLRKRVIMLRFCDDISENTR